MSNNDAELRRLKRSDGAAAKRCAGRLLAMRPRLGDIRRRKSDGSLLLATWNIRDVDSDTFGLGPRLLETFLSIAEVVAGGMVGLDLSVVRATAAPPRPRRSPGRGGRGRCPSATRSGTRSRPTSPTTI